MTLGRLIAGIGIIIMAGFMFYFMLGYGAMLLNEYFPDVEANPYAALVIELIFITPAIILFIIGLWIIDEPEQTGGYTQ